MSFCGLYVLNTETRSHRVFVSLCFNYQPRGGEGKNEMSSNDRAHALSSVMSPILGSALHDNITTIFYIHLWQFAYHDKYTGYHMLCCFLEHHAKPHFLLLLLKMFLYLHHVLYKHLLL